MNKLTDEQAKQANEIVENYRNKMEASVRELEKHRIPCGEEEYIAVVGRQLGATEKNEIEFPPGGEILPLNSEKDCIIIKTGESDEKNRGE